MVAARNPVAEAADVLGDGLVGRVLEPSPPAVLDGELFADDPVHAEVGAGRIVAPVDGDISWAELIATTRPDLASWAAERSLAPNGPLRPIPDSYGEQRRALHRLATFVIAPARHQANGKFGLRWTKGGFGTPFYGADVQVRVDGTELVVQEAGAARSSAITSLRHAASFIGSEIDAEVAAEHDSPPLGDVDEPLVVSAATSEFLAAWWGMGFAALERFRAAEETVAPSRVQLWPGHFDPAIEAGDDDHRASYGASPGDDGSAEPYLYVSVWYPDRLDIDSGDPTWNATGYVGAILPFAELATSDDPVSVAADFYRAVRDRLDASTRLSG